MLANMIVTFINEHPELYERMNKVSHMYNDEVPNAFHLEGSIWTHTCMVIKETEKYNDIVLSLAALCHDIGKAFVADDKHEKKRRRFTNHESVSVFYTKKVLESFDVTIEEKRRILQIVGQHGSMYNFFEDGRIPEKNWEKIATRYSYQDFCDLVKFYECDHNGRFHVEAENQREKEAVMDMRAIEKIIRTREVAFTGPKKDKTLTVLIGPPRAGKSTWVANNVTDEVVISRDSLVEQMGTGDNYSECWRSLTETHHKELDKMVQEQFQKAVKQGQDIVIDMTNMSKKSRRKWLSNAKDYHRVGRVFIEPKECLLDRNCSEKHIPEPVIDRMMQNFVWPQYDEFEEIVWLD